MKLVRCKPPQQESTDGESKEEKGSAHPQSDLPPGKHELGTVDDGGRATKASEDSWFMMSPEHASNDYLKSKSPDPVMHEDVSTEPTETP